MIIRTDIEQCKSCRNLIRWVITEQGKTMPVDAFPDEHRGNISLYESGGKTRGVVVPKQKADAMRANGKGLHLSHFATCPDAAGYRQKHR